MNDTVSSEQMIHATCVAQDGRAVLITGRSGAGKSDLAVRLIDRGFSLVSDDQTIVRRDRDRLLASAPQTIAGKIEVRGLGILAVGHVDDVPVSLVVELKSEIERMPKENRHCQLQGLSLPLISIDAMTASAAAKVAMALDIMGQR